jgi:DNA-binding NarL/FixJ family response regulator
MDPMTAHKTTFVIADDHDLVRKGVQHVVEAHDDWRIVAQASDGREALEAITQYRPAIAIIDYFLPHLNGLELTRLARHASPNTEILVFTMVNDEGVIRDVLAAGAKGFVFKTDTSEQIQAAIHALVRHRPWFSESISETLLTKFLANSDHQSGTLTHREREVVQLVAEGKINKEIGAALGISVKTVETHRSTVMHKLQLKTLAQLVRYAVRNHIVQA